MLIKNYSIAVITLTTCLLAACSKKEQDNTPPPPPVPDVIIKDLPAGEKTGNPTGAKRDTLFFSFATKGKTTATAKWDIGFTGIYNTNIIANTDANAWMELTDMQYERVNAAPPLAYNLASVSADGDGLRGWFRYNMSTHVVTVVPGRTIFVKLANKSVYKLEMKSIYAGSPANPDVNTPAPFLNFRYALLP